MCQCNNGNTLGYRYNDYNCGCGSSGNVGGVSSGNCGCGNSGNVGGVSSGNCGCGNSGNVGGVSSGNCGCGRKSKKCCGGVLGCAACGIYNTIFRIVNGVDNTLSGCGCSGNCGSGCGCDN